MSYVTLIVLPSLSENAAEAVDWLNEADLPSYVISTYTALHSTRALLKKKEEEVHA